MYLFSKIATTSSVVLGLTGLALFLSPLGLEGNSQMIDAIYKEIASKLNIWDLTTLLDSENEQVTDKLIPLLAVFEAGFSSVENQSKEKSQKVKEILEKLSTSESDLKGLYQENSANLKQLEEKLQKLNVEQKKVLELKSLLSLATNSKNTLKALTTNLERMGSSLETILCHLKEENSQSPPPGLKNRNVIIKETCWRSLKI